MGLVAFCGGRIGVEALWSALLKFGTGMVGAPVFRVAFGGKLRRNLRKGNSV